MDIHNVVEKMFKAKLYTIIFPVFRFLADSRICATSFELSLSMSH